MHKEMLNRIKTAGEYQKKAIRALFPEKVGGHLDVIEKEMRMIFVEIAADMMKECKKKDKKKDDGEETQEDGKEPGVRKVDIL